ncbi:hypothetical protein KL918_003713 [Ogataea parapolymorpha]|uniref:Tyrosine--tRNA ligase n=1 Tax=Ogataea parapolymorpha (strain ATCC 26012 / BCRC 20466 / JCM 22074 / NRRL Y-7560 / DL-1) TaxID=871575 RepID=W1QIP6_OGAPD|nr:Mitochondrial tyrosyl-tRNA synthetase [Ogataea parapolymorpha DL-1]ESX02169.1 Mitochondrial tyrosyl-tRNA synthetase [Ogataea parapolymorpha DL-1]KAG7866248.1 hypothetical protein KL918_003713 [Ogataea parapolymorpha]KAG7871381.1 hypothetical protein KL916_004176 [Ogataea parapolymorpha]
MSLTRLFSTTRQVRAFPLAVKELLARHSIDARPGDFEADANEPIIDHLRRRSLIETVVNEDQLARLAREKTLGLYCGADPTAKSLHLGNLLPLMVLLHFNLRGHSITALVGGATGTVGDPSGKTTERAQMEQQERLDNVARIQAQFEQFFRNGRRYAASRNHVLDRPHGEVAVRNNYDWWKDMGFLEFLARYGRFIRVNQMLSRDSIRSRLDSEQGIGFNEFTYQLLQAYDFYYLNKNHGIDVQVGGNDQYGNIVAGLDLIDRMHPGEKKKAFGVTVPLLTTANGVKFGKSAGNAVFIDKNLTPSFQLYQFLYNTLDEDVPKLLYKFSLLPTALIERVCDFHRQNRALRLGQRLLAVEMCDFLHGDGEGRANLVISDALYEDTELDVDEVLAAFRRQNMITAVCEEELASVGDLLHRKLAGVSKKEIKRLLAGGAVSVGKQRVKLSRWDDPVDRTLVLDGRLLLIRTGKQVHVFEVK